MLWLWTETIHSFSDTVVSWAISTSQPRNDSIKNTYGWQSFRVHFFFLSNAPFIHFHSIYCCYFWPHSSPKDKQKNIHWYSALPYFDSHFMNGSNQSLGENKKLKKTNPASDSKSLRLYRSSVPCLLYSFGQLVLPLWVLPFLCIKLG